MDEIVVASKNKGKIKEIRNILSGTDIKVVSMEEVGFNEDIEETGKTFYENALIKAGAIYDKTKSVVLSDDSGLEVEYLDNAPGVYSARFAQNDDARIEKLLGLLQNVPENKRKARFVCSMVLYINEQYYVSAEGTVDGYIATDRNGSKGFGYDPVFYLPEYHKTMAEVSENVKNKISHRAKALEQIVQKIKELNV
ncbi:MAG: XTP/dITP diphosphatase [Clostridiales bacterium]|nr:XTP/dITP diphosphatase [Clostridiales bacterium]